MLSGCSFPLFVIPGLTRNPVFLSLKDQKIALLEHRGTNLEKENDLLKQQNAIQEKLTELAKREAEVYRTALEKEKELTDGALKLAEIELGVTRIVRTGRFCSWASGR